MIALIIGGSASGKSEFAENFTLDISPLAQAEGDDVLYIATMKPFDDESLKRIARHREQRKHKGFETKEVYTDLLNAFSQPHTYCAVLLECMSNLLANEMYSEYPPSSSCCDKILSGVDKLAQCSSNTIIVSNEVFCDGDSYSEETLLYIKQLGDINRRLAQKADIVVEVICGIPIYHKGLKQSERSRS